MAVDVDVIDGLSQGGYRKNGRSGEFVPIKDEWKRETITRVEPQRRGEKFAS